MRIAERVRDTITVVNNKRYSTCMYITCTLSFLIRAPLQQCGDLGVADLPGVMQGGGGGAHTLVECLSREETEGGGKETREGRESLGEVIEGGASLNADLHK